MCCVASIIISARAPVSLLALQRDRGLWQASTRTLGLLVGKAVSGWLLPGMPLHDPPFWERRQQVSRAPLVTATCALRTRTVSCARQKLHVTAAC